ncbi:MAG TPA: Flp family type IVb pilin [Novosphingobium sp.]|nr:Flp family type IVb pilin [Novosphingobium sp.]
MAVLSFLVRLLKDNKALSAVEYGLICSLIVLAMIAGLQNFASGVINMWNNVATQVSTAVAQANGNAAS